MTKSNSSKVSRRGFVVGSAAAVATAASTLTASGCSSSSTTEEIITSVSEQFPLAHVEYLSVDPSQIFPHVSMTTRDTADYVREVNSFDLPLGSLVYQSSDTQALVIAPGASSKALIQLGFANLESGEYLPILEKAFGAGEDYVVYDARASDSCVAWVECNMVHGQWRVYALSFEKGNVSEESMQRAQLLEEGEGDYSPPQLAVSGNKVYWTVMPDPNGPASSEDSYLKAVELTGRRAGETVEPRVVYTSHGRMISSPTVSGNVLTIVPRVDFDTVYYQLTALDIVSDEVKDIAILPPSLRVANAVWLDSGFVFGIEGNYDYAEGLSLFGTYQQLEEGQYLYVNKAPVSAAVQVNGFMYVKSTKNILGLDASRGNALVVDTPRDCVSYGDILAGSGTQNRLVVYTTVVSRIGQQSRACKVRVLDPLR